MRYAVAQRSTQRIAFGRTLLFAHLLLCASLLFFSQQPSAFAQACHPMAPPSPSSKIHAHAARPINTFRVALNSEFATYKNSRFEGEYQGLAIAGTWQHRWIQLHVSMPAYRIVRNGIAKQGLGDLLLNVHVPIARWHHDTLTIGVGLAATAPTGDTSIDLGMGHWMLMPSVWSSWHGARAFVTAQLVYGRALVGRHGSTAHHGGGPASVPNPMNMSEIEAAIAFGYELVPRLRIRAGSAGAVPVATTHGVARTVAFAGIDLLFPWLHVSAEQHFPIVGDPFRAKTMVSLAVPL